MVNISKKRSAATKIQSKPTKVAKTEEIVQDQVEEGLFDNLDEEMDPAVLDDMMNHINEEEGEEEEDEEEEEEEDDDEEEEEEDDDDGEAVVQETELEADNEEEDDKMEEDEPDVPETLEQKSTAKRFRDLYMTKVTQAFGTDLDIIRQEPNLNGPRLNILIDSLEAGIDIFSPLEQEIILADEEK